MALYNVLQEDFYTKDTRINMDSFIYFEILHFGIKLHRPSHQYGTVHQEDCWKIASRKSHSHFLNNWNSWTEWGTRRYPDYLSPGCPRLPAPRPEKISADDDGFGRPRFRIRWTRPSVCPPISRLTRTTRHCCSCFGKFGLVYGRGHGQPQLE